MAFIGSLVTTLKANTDPYKKGLKGAESNTKKFEKVLKNSAMAAGAFAAAIGAAAVTALVAYTAKAFKAIDSTAKLASELEIGTAALMGYQLAAGLSGVETETLNKSMEKMAKIVGEARLGVTTGTKALEDFGISLRDLEGMNTQEVFEKFADEIAGIPDPMERAAKASLIFGRSGIKLLNFLSLGSSGLASVREEVEALGLSFSEVEAGKVEEANDALLKISKVFEGLGTTIAIGIAPSIAEAADAVTDWVKKSGGINETINPAVKTTVKLFKDLASIAGVVGDAVGILIDQAPGLKLLGLALSSGDDTGGDEFKEFKKRKAQQRKDTLKFEQEVAAIINKRKDAEVKAAEEAKKAGIAKDKALAKSKEEAIKKELAALKSIADEQQSIFDETRTPLEEIEIKLKRIRELMKFDPSIENLDAMKREIANLEAEREKINDAPGKEKREAAQRKADDAKAKADAEHIRNIQKINDEVAKIFEETRTPLEAIEAEIERIIELMAKGFDEELQGGLERKLAELRAEKDKLGLGKEGQALVGSFREIDLKNLNIAGIDRSGDIGKKSLDENVKQTDILKQIRDNSAQDFNSGALTV